jgi:hypothetical protein
VVFCPSRVFRTLYPLASYLVCSWSFACYVSAWLRLPTILWCQAFPTFHLRDMTGIVRPSWPLKTGIGSVPDRCTQITVDMSRDYYNVYDLPIEISYPAENANIPIYAFFYYRQNRLRSGERACLMTFAIADETYSSSFHII